MLVILGLAGAMAVATSFESVYDTPTGQYYVYRTLWFYGLLALLGVNIFCVAVSRWPWKRRHIPFLLAHLGILMMLTGSWLTFRFGVDGQLIVSEGEVMSAVNLEGNVLELNDGSGRWVLPLPFRPPTAGFDPIPLKSLGVQVDQYIPHAEEVLRFEAPPAGTKANPDPAQWKPYLHAKLEIARVGASQALKLWLGDTQMASQQMGPALFSVVPHGFAFAPLKGQTSGQMGPSLRFRVERDGGLAYQIHSRDGATRVGKLAASQVVGAVIEPGWMGMKITIKEWVPDAVNTSFFKPARVQYGTDAPGPAIYLRPLSGETGTWLGHWERKFVKLGDKRYRASFAPEQLFLPFFIFLQRFNIEHYEGTQNPASYSSQVKVTGSESGNSSPQSDVITISMNEPLHHNGYTFYQSSYIPGEPRPVTSVFSVNKDPGRELKYLGAILIVLGSILLFVVKYFKIAFFR